MFAASCNAAGKFPPGFRFGAATSSYQVEGAWNVSDKTPSVWDKFAHENPELISDRSNGDVACDSYHLWEEDVAIAKKIGLHFYRFSISWPRLLPNGFTNIISQDGTRYYNNLIDGLLKNGIEPVVTLYHWDLPQTLQDLGGWTNPEIAIWFEDYARVAFTLFGDRVKTWVTFNEPIVFCDVVYSTGFVAPKVLSPGIGNYISAKNVMMAHARAYRLYDKEFRHKCKGKVGLTNNHIWYEAGTPDYEEKTELARNLAAIYAHPIYSKKGGWPANVEKYIKKKSKEEGYPRSKLPAFTREEIEFVRGTFDYYGINYYTSRLVFPEENITGPYNFWPIFGSRELGITLKPDPSWKAGHEWLVSYPAGLRKQLIWLVQQYGDIEIKILENGFSTRDREMNDLDRIEYYKDHLEQVLLSIKEDGLNITAYTAWSLMDNYEWIGGYTSKFGLTDVDFEDPKRKRTLRASASYYAAVIKKHSINV